MPRYTTRLLASLLASASVITTAAMPRVPPASHRTVAATPLAFAADQAS